MPRAESAAALLAPEVNDDKDGQEDDGDPEIRWHSGVPPVKGSEPSGDGCADSNTPPTGAAWRDCTVIADEGKRTRDVGVNLAYYAPP